MWSCGHYCCRSCSYVGATIVAMLVRTCVSHKMVTIVANKSVFAFFVNAFFLPVLLWLVCCLCSWTPNLFNGLLMVVKSTTCVPFELNVVVWHIMVISCLCVHAEI